MNLSSMLFRGGGGGISLGDRARRIGGRGGGGHFDRVGLRRRRPRVGPEDFNFAKLLVLDRAELAEANQFQQGEERGHDFQPAGRPGEQVGKPQARARRHRPPNLLDLFADGPAILEQVCESSGAVKRFKM